jgi:hypothetical protein
MIKFLEGLTSDKDHIRHGSYQIFIYLPTLLKEKFSPYITQSLPLILEGLSDFIEHVRDSAFQSCKILVGLYASTHIGIIFYLNFFN